MTEANSGRPRILVVDDNITNLKVAKEALAGLYDVFTAPSAAKMFRLLETMTPELIFLDIVMPEMDGFEALRELRTKDRFRDIPIIFLTGKTDDESQFDGLELGAVDYITKPFSPRLLRKRAEIHRTLQSQRLTLERQKTELQNFNLNLKQMVEEKAGHVLDLQGAILNTVADLVESRDDITGDHVGRTQHWLNILVTALDEHGIYRDYTAKWDRRFLISSSQLHDVGKIAISDHILRKPGPLTREEFEEMKRHVDFGVRIIDKIASGLPENDFLRQARLFVWTHHERWDGSGYPRGLRGEDIPLEGRLMAIADTYDALISHRPYKNAYAHEEAVGIIARSRGRHFDPVLADLFQEREQLFKEQNVGPAPKYYAR